MTANPSNLPDCKIFCQTKNDPICDQKCLIWVLLGNELEFKKTFVIFEISTLEFVKNKSLTHTVNFGIASAFSQGPGSAFSEGLRLDPLTKYAL